MGKVLLFILGAYVLYYVVNIIYDLFFANQKAAAHQDEGQLVSMNKDDEPPDIKRFGIDDVEEVEVPKSYVVDEVELYEDNDTPTNYDAEAFRTNYEEEAELEKYSSSQPEKQLLEQENQEKKLIVSHLLNGIRTPTEKFISNTKEVISNALDTDKFDDFLNIANQHVVLTSNIDGHKVFKSTL